MARIFLNASILLCVLLLVACGSASVAGGYTTPEAVSEQRSVTSHAMSTLPAACTQQKMPLRDQLRQAQHEVKTRFGDIVHTAWGDVDFQLLIPTDIADYQGAVVSITGQGAPPVVNTCLVDKRSPDRWIGVGQSVGGFGALSNDPVAWSAWESITIQGAPAQLRSGMDERSNEALVQLYWDQHGISYFLTGHNVTAETVVRIANSLQPLR
jgi:hypothetical protein